MWGYISNGIDLEFSHSGGGETGEVELSHFFSSHTFVSTSSSKGAGWGFLWDVSMFRF